MILNRWRRRGTGKLLIGERSTTRKSMAGRENNKQVIKRKNCFKEAVRQNRRVAGRGVKDTCGRNIGVERGLREVARQGPCFDTRSRLALKSTAAEETAQRQNFGLEVL